MHKGEYIALKKKNDGKASQAGAIRFRLSLTEIFYNFCIASANFQTALLQSLGIPAGQIGMLSSMTTAAGIVAPPIWGVISDKIHSTRKCFVICLSFAAALMALVPVVAAVSTGNYLWLFALLILVTLFTGPAYTMMEMWLVHVNDSEYGISYGSIRIWASMGFAVMGLIYVPLFKIWPITSAYWMYGLFAIPAVLLALWVPKTGAETSGMKRAKLRDMPFKKLLTYWIIAYIIYFTINQIPHNWKITYFIYVLTDYGYDASAFAAFMSVSAFLEVPTLLFSRRIIDRFGMVKPLVMCLLASAAECMLYTFGTSLVAIIIGQIIRGLQNGMMMACQIQYIHKLAPEGLATTTQALVSSIGTIASIVISLFGGFILEAMGVRPFYFLLVILQLFSAGVFVGTFIFGRRALKKEIPAGVL